MDHNVTVKNTDVDSRCGHKWKKVSVGETSFLR